MFPLPSSWWFHKVPNDSVMYVHLKKGNQPNHITLNRTLIVMFWLKSCCKLILMKIRLNSCIKISQFIRIIKESLSLTYTANAGEIQVENFSK